MRGASEQPWQGGAAAHGRTAVRVEGAGLGWDLLHAQAAALAARLPAGAAVCLLCRGTAAFLAGMLATWRCGGTVVLPPSGGRTDVDALLQAAGVSAVLVDGDGTAPGLDRPALPTLHVSLREAQPTEAGPLPDAMPAAESLQLRLYTSGSTGVPQAQAKRLDHLVLGAELLHARLSAALGGGDRVRHVVCSVPPQHMFGLEAAVMPALVHGLPVAEGRPLLPADVAAAFGAGPAEGLWVATPLHLRAIVRAGTRLPGCAAVLVSTSALSAALAAEAEALLGVPVLEIYGSTETGALALRRTAVEPDWTPFDGVTLEPDDEGCVVRGRHFASPCRVADLVERVDGTRFRLLGRAADLVKIGGRRASLAGLNQIVEQMPGLDEGVLHCPPADGPAADGLPQRLVLIHAGRPLDVAAARAWLQSRLDPAFVPRAFVHVAALPRTEAGKLRRTELDALVAQWRRRGGTAA